MNEYCNENINKYYMNEYYNKSINTAGKESAQLLNSDTRLHDYCMNTVFIPHEYCLNTT